MGRNNTNDLSPKLESTSPLGSLPIQHTHLVDSGTKEIKEGYHIEQFDTELPKDSKRKIRTPHKEIFPDNNNSKY